jgi:hypothetical protein
MPANFIERLENKANFHGACTYDAHQQAEVAENFGCENVALVRLPPIHLILSLWCLLSVH